MKASQTPLLGLCLLAAALGLAAPLYANEARTIVFLGDSLTAGYGLENPGKESYPALIQEKIDDAHLSWKVVNAGESGDTSADGLRRVDWVLREPPGIFVLALGANDGLRGLSPELTRDNLEAIAENVHRRYPGARIVIAGMLMPPSVGADYAAAFAKVFPEVAEREHALLIPFLLDGVGGKPELNQGDGIHPTAKGDILVAETVWKTLKPLLTQ